MSIRAAICEKCQARIRRLGPMKITSKAAHPSHAAQSAIARV